MQVRLLARSGLPDKSFHGVGLDLLNYGVSWCHSWCQAFLGVRLDLLNFRNPRILRIELEPMKITGVAGISVGLLFSESRTILEDGPQSAKGTRSSNW